MPLPRIDDMIDRLAKAKYFSKLDFTSGYYQVKLTDAAREKSAFSTPDGHYEWTVMGMGLCNAPATFQRLMYKVLGGLLWTNSMAYLDDIVVFSSDYDVHLKDLRAVFERIRAAKLKIKPPKCAFAKTGIQYLGFIITRHGVEADPANVRKVDDFEPPQSKEQVLSFLGLTSYYRKFIKDYAMKAKPLYQLLKQDNPFKWEDAEAKAFETLKTELTSPPILAFPDFEKEFIVSTDASQYGIGAILKQEDSDGKERVIAYASRVLNDAETRYAVVEKELLALKWATQVFHPYLHGTRFKVTTDHQSLRELKHFKTTNSRIQRFNVHLSDFDFYVVYKEGKKNKDADALSRYGFDSTSAAKDQTPDPPTSDIITPSTARQENAHFIRSHSDAIQNIIRDMDIGQTLQQKAINLMRRQRLPRYNWELDIVHHVKSAAHAAQQSEDVTHVLTIQQPEESTGGRRRSKSADAGISHKKVKTETPCATSSTAATSIEQAAVPAVESAAAAPQSPKTSTIPKATPRSPSTITAMTESGETDSDVSEIYNPEALPITYL
jgi:hypothetical protein